MGAANKLRKLKVQREKLILVAKKLQAKKKIIDAEKAEVRRLKLEVRRLREQAGVTVRGLVKGAVRTAKSPATKAKAKKVMKAWDKFRNFATRVNKIDLS